MTMDAALTTKSDTVDADALVARMFADEGTSLVRLARFFCDDRNAAVEGGRRASLGAPMTAQIQVRPAAARPLPPVPANAPLRVSILGVNFSGND